MSAAPSPAELPEHVDVVIVGAGLSGIAAAYYLQRELPARSYLVIEGRQALGGTWDLFRYPGIRSDSDMHTLGYSFAPWTGERSIADGASIRTYLEDTARAHGIERHIRYGLKVTAAAWSSADARWTVTMTAADGATRTVRCGFLFMCSGYYAYDRGHSPTWPGQDQFRGRLIHPQHWPADLDHAGKRIVVIGSGATAITLVPSLAETAAHVTMLQRSPTFLFNRPAIDPLHRRLRGLVPPRVAGEVTRWKYIGLSAAFYQFCRRFPDRARRFLTRQVREQLPADYAVDTHFNPRYQPWDERLCVVPDGDLFHALRDGRASIVTDTIDRFTADGLRLASGQELAADIVVTATGLRLLFLGGVALTVDGQVIEPGGTRVYRGAMLAGVPNLAMAVGYTNASWTLRVELVAAFVCRLLQHLDRHGHQSAVPEPLAGDDHDDRPLLDLQAGYVQRAVDAFPRQGARDPWKLHQAYLPDVLNLKLRPIADGRLRFDRGLRPATATAPPGDRPAGPAAGSRATPAR